MKKIIIRKRNGKLLSPAVAHAQTMPDCDDDICILTDPAVFTCIESCETKLWYIMGAYVIKCPCGRETHQHATKQAAINEWNKIRLE